MKRICRLPIQFNNKTIYHDIMIAEWINRGYNNTMQYYCGEEVG